MAKGRHGCTGNGAICSRIWKENMFRLNPKTGLTHEVSPEVESTQIPPLRDPQGRHLDYLRLSVTDRCNLRCRYCMPADGIKLAARENVLTLEEMQRLGAIFAQLGVRKIRITGGEPLLRKGVVSLIAGLQGLPSSPEILMTTNGLLLEANLHDLQAAGLRRINLSLDTLKPEKWRDITRRGGHDTVLKAMDLVLAKGMGLKINVVVLPGENVNEIPDFVALTKDRDVSIRFIEPMPFDGTGKPLAATVNGDDILGFIRPHYELKALTNPDGAVDKLYAVKGHRGNIGIIEGHSRTFCSSCRRLRLNASGEFRTCLYGRPQANLRLLMRGGATDTDLMAVIRDAVEKRLVDGFAAEKDSKLFGLKSMVDIGG